MAHVRWYVCLSGCLGVSGIIILWEDFACTFGYCEEFCVVVVFFNEFNGIEVYVI